jgi:hypothetical protein
VEAIYSKWSVTKDGEQDTLEILILRITDLPGGIAEAIDIDIEDQNRELLSLWHRIDHEEEEIQFNDTKKLALMSRIQELRTDYNNAKRDTAAAAAEEHATENDRMERQELINEFSRLLKAIEYLQSRCESYIGMEKKLSKDQAHAILKHLGGDKSRRNDAEFVELAMDRSPPLRHIVGCLLRRYLDSALLAHVFEPFVPGTSTNFLSETRFQVQKVESQSTSAQWRSLTYKYSLGMREKNWSAGPAAQFTQELERLLHAAGQGQLPTHAVEAANQITTQTFEAAAQFKDRAMLRCSEFDFYIYTPFDDGNFYPEVMSEVHPSRWMVSSSRVILPVGLGLIICKSIQENSKTVQRYEYPILASVIGDSSWLLSYQLWGSGSRDR